MTIKIEGTEMQSVDQLTGRNQLIVSMIPNALPWIQSNISRKSNTLVFANEDELIGQIGLGLSATSVIELAGAGLTLDAKKFIDFSTEDVIALTIDEKDADNQSAQLSALIHRYHLLTNIELSTVTSVIEQSQLPLPIHWTVGLKDRVNCYRCLNYAGRVMPVKSSVMKEASKWALSRAQTLTEFGHYYCVYLRFVTSNNNGAQVSSESINQAVDALTSVVLECLDCPLVTFELDDKNLKSAFGQWVDSGNALGFSNLASGLLSIVMNIDLRAKGALEPEAARYLQQLKTLLCEKLANDTYISQAGQCRHYVYSLPEREIVVNVDEIGCLSIYSDLPTGTSASSQTLSIN